MIRPDRDIFGRLGPAGLTRVLDDLLDATRLVRLANACGVGYPGMRTQSQPRRRLLRDIVDRAAREESARRAVLKTLGKETGGPAREWARLTTEQKVARLEANGAGQVGLSLLFAASESADPALETALARALASGAPATAEPAPSTDAVSDDAGEPQTTAAEADEPAAELDVAHPAREVARLERRNFELQKKLHHLEGQLTRTRELAKDLKRDLIERKGELAESRMLVERTQRELREAKEAARRPAASPSAGTSPAPDDLAEIAKVVRRLAADQRKLQHGIEKLASAPAPSAVLPEDALAPLLTGLEELRKETQGSRRDRKKELATVAQKLDEMRSAVRVLAEAAEATPHRRSKAAPRRKGEPERVGVFVDVQNMYYGARQLKGKLDFDALLQAAVRDRRLIQAVAYVVESKEIDQSGFIAMLQQRAIHVRRKTLKVRSDGSMKGDWDMEMALDILDSANSLDVVVLVSGDGDFTSLVNRVKAMGPKVEVIAFPRNTAKSLVESADAYQPLDRKFMIRQEPQPGEVEPERAPPVHVKAHTSKSAATEAAAASEATDKEQPAVGAASTS